MPDQRSAPRSADEIKADIERTQDHLAGTIDELSVRVAPKNLAERAKKDAKAQVVDPVTGPRWERIAPVVGGVALVVIIRVVRARLRRRH